MPAVLKRSANAWPRAGVDAKWPAVDRRRRSRSVVLPVRPFWEVEPGGDRSLFYCAAKRMIDLLGSVALLLFFSPLLVMVTLILWITTRGKPIFHQERLGHCGRRFTLYKFRTMVVGAAQQREKVHNDQTGPVFKNSRDPRITRIGRILHKTSLDEFPQLFNVLTGSMSLVGPRPPIESEALRYEPWQQRRLSVKPGLTCLW